jgi:Ni2+-binding GTPase involved in maturation of urease and hydrogenase
VRFRLEEVREQVGALRPDGRLLVLSATTGEGLDGWLELLRERLAAKRAAAGARA